MTIGTRQRRTTYRLLLTLLWITLLTLGVEAIAGWISQSLLLLAEALHTLIDAFSVGLSLVAVAAPQRPLGREIWGHGRAEVVGTLIMGSLLGFLGVSLLLAASQQGIAVLWQGSATFSVTIDRPVVYLMVGLVALHLGVALVGSLRSRVLGSLALNLTSQHILADAWLSGMTLVGVIAIWQQQRWVDIGLASVLTVLAGRSFWQVLGGQLPLFVRPMAIAPEAIAHIATQVEGVTRCIRIRSRGLVGRQVWVELHLAIHPEFLGIAHLLGERVDAALRQHYGPIHTQIWVEESPPSPPNYFNPPAPTPWQPESSAETDWM